MINLSGRTFKNNLTNDIVKVLDSFEDIAILEDKSRVDTRHLTNPSLFTEITSSQPIINENYFTPVEVEEVKPENFFSNQNAYNSLADKIKNIPQELIRDDPNAGTTSVRIQDPDGNPTTDAFDRVVATPTSESAVVQISDDDERALLAKKYGVINPAESINKQNEAFSELLGDETPPNQDVPLIRNDIYEDDNNIQRFEAKRETYDTYKNSQVPLIEDPIIKMFKGVKRIIDFNVSIQIDNKIPRVDFIEMMEDSYETSIIDFFAEEFTNNILDNPQMIKDMIKEKITELVYGKSKNIIKPTPPESQIVVEGENPVKKEVKTRKPRVKKEVVK